MASWSQNTSPHPTNGRTPAYKAAAPIQLHVFRGCSKFAEYDVLRKLGEGTFGEVHQAKSKKTGAIVALKKILMHNEKDGFPITALREIKLLKLLDHINILRLEEMAVEHSQKPNDKRMKSIMYMVTPYMDHDLSGLLENPSVHFTVPQIKCYMVQLLKGTAYLHEQHILHRDMKAANLLINNKGILQIADFGLARHYEGDVPHAGGFTGEAVREYTTLVVTRWYRPPELLLQLRKYTPAIDLWGVGCVFGEMLFGRPILAGESDSRQLEMIFELVGSPSEQNMPGWKALPGGADINPPFRSPTIVRRFEKDGPGAISLLTELLKLDWRKRVNAVDALKHRYFTDHPQAARPEDIPHFEESHELDRRGVKGHKGPGLPPAPRGYAVGGEPGGGPRPYVANGDTWTTTSRGHENGGHHQNAGYGAPRGRGGYVQPTWRAGQGQRVHDAPRVGNRDYGSSITWGGDGSRSDRPHGDHRDRDRERDHAQRRSPRRGGGDVYVPSYSSGRRDDRVRDDRRGGWDDRDDRRHPSHPHPHRERLEYDDRSRGGHTRSRSRSPLPPRERIRDRESIDRDVYRR